MTYDGPILWSKLKQLLKILSQYSRKVTTVSVVFLFRNLEHDAYLFAADSDCRRWRHKNLQNTLSIDFILF